jgi:hypothetical protein
METTLLTRLQNWYITNCDDVWEHQFGVSIATLDNPGWKVKINLLDTCLQELRYEKQFDNGTFNWLSIKVTEKVFEATGDPSKLTIILETFLDEIIPKYADPDFEYKVYVSLTGGPTKIWRPAKAKMISEDVLQIIRFPDLNYNDIRTLSVDDITFEKEDIFKYKTNVSVGDNVKVELEETFMGVTLIAQEKLQATNKASSGSESQR